MHAPAVEAEVKKDDVVSFIADITTKTAPGKRLLTELDEVSIPLVAVFGRGVQGNGHPYRDGIGVLKTQAYTDTSLVEMIEDARVEP